MKKKILVIVACILAVIAVLSGIYLGEESQKAVEELKNVVVNEIENIEIDNTITVTDKKENISTTEIEDLTEQQEIELEEQETEAESFELQGNIAYEGERAKHWNVELGDYAGLTYYSQVDSRWKNHVYTSINDKTQTIGTSGCGPTSAAMIVSSIKGNITPDKMGDLFAEHGYRSANSGTYWSAFRAAADEFDIDYQETNNLDKAIELLKNNNYLIASVGNGLFTYGGHFIVLVGIDGNNIKIYDPYLYNGKFTTSTRRNKVTVSGNTVYCSVDNFRQYANYKGFFAFGYSPEETIKENITDEKVTVKENIVNTVGNTYTLNIKTNLFANSNMSKGYTYKKGTKIKVLENITSKIDKIQIVKTGIIRYAYNNDYITSKTTSQNKNTGNLIIGKTYSLSNSTKLFTSQNGGYGYNYKKGTKVKVLEITNSNVKVQIIKTGLVRYVNSKYLK